jgi:hypothetical protein
MNNNIIKKISFICVIVLAIFGIRILSQHVWTKSTVEKCANLATLMDVEDWWGNPIKIHRLPSDDGTAVIYIAIAAGKDREYDTADDYSAQSVNFNWSKMAGQHVGEMTKEGTKGFFKGIFKKNEHSDSKKDKESVEHDLPHNLLQRKYGWNKEEETK